MRNTRKLQEVQFDSLEELFKFVNDGGNAQFYDDWDASYIPIGTNDDKIGGLIFANDGWDEVKECHLSNIYGYIKIAE